MKSKGFTLIELLAVIVILAVIAIISVPVILNVIEDAKKESFKNTAYGILESASLYYTQATLKNEVVPTVFTCDYDKCGDLKFKGAVPSGTVTIYSDLTNSIVITNKDYCAYKNGNDEKITVVEGDCTGITVAQYVSGTSDNVTITDILNQVTALNTNVQANTSDIATMQTQISSISSNITTNNTDIATLKTQISNLGTNVSANYTSIAALETKVNNLLLTKVYDLSSYMNISPDFYYVAPKAYVTGNQVRIVCLISHSFGAPNSSLLLTLPASLRPDTAQTIPGQSFLYGSTATTGTAYGSAQVILGTDGKVITNNVTGSTEYNLSIDATYYLDL